MSFKIVFCLSTVLLQTISGQYIGKGFNGGVIGAGLAAAENAALANSMAYGAPLAANGLAYEAAISANGPYGPNLAPGSSITNGGGFRVTSSSPIPASGVSVQSENLVIEGPLAVSGQLPFLGVVALEGPLPAAGQGAVAYGCGNGNVGIVNEGVEPVVAPAYANGLPNGLGYNGLPNGLGYGPIY
ncbi:chorion class B protein PC10-like [Vanessa atalanta]|uniref:chorion class B protein PC10-like n=1 Tax=Vanessa atalanta TaxID=42275 RepID=UPI001FCE0E83|nr:chorion class B protein PC10-like [Vanessa atalanta]